MDFENYIDITPLISSQLAVFPGDQAFERKEVMSCDDGDHLTLSSINTTVHLGAHADAPNHYCKKAPGIDARNLKYYMGPCQVVDMTHCHGAIDINDINIEDITEARVLFKSNSIKDTNAWQDDFSYLTPLLVDALANKGVITVGIDTPSIDPSKSKALSAHQRVNDHNLAILEGIDLRSVNQGRYILLALPLKLKDCDASPVRAILLPFLNSISN